MSKYSPKHLFNRKHNAGVCTKDEYIKHIKSSPILTNNEKQVKVNNIPFGYIIKNGSPTISTKILF